MTDSQPDRTTVTAEGAPAAIGPYSHAVRHGGLLFCSGALPVDPATEGLLDGPVAAQTRRCLENLEVVCGAAGGALADAVRLTVFTTRLEEFAAINEAYAAFFPAEPPARVAIGAASLPKGAAVEIDAIVALP